jgi:phage N-6-adenine-methyltransferase
VTLAIARPLMSSLTDDWGTPSEFYAGLHHEFGFTLDVAASHTNAKCDRYFTVEDDGLAQPWAPEICWMNPPYGRSIPAWVAKAWHESTLGATVVGLLPARTDTAWWHDYVLKAGELRFVRGRLRFYGIAKDAPFPSAVAIWRPA